MQNVKLKILDIRAVIPNYATDGSSGFDFFAIEDQVIEAGKTALVSTGLSFELEQGTELQIRPRSGVSLKTGLRVANSPATIDSDYRGEVKIIIQNTGTEAYTIKKMDRIAQGVICPILKASFTITTELSNSIRGSGGFGSTGV